MSRKHRSNQRDRVSRPSIPRTKNRDNASRNGISADGSRWVLINQAGTHELGLVAQCIADVADYITRVEQLSKTNQLRATTFQRESRHISVQVRKLLLSNDEQLLKRCFVPRLHPLLTPVEQTPTLLTNWIGDLGITFNNGDSSQAKKVTLPTAHTHETLVNPLYGVMRLDEKQYRLGELVDWSSETVKAKNWLNRKVLQVNGISMTAEELLRMMSNREGAHSDPNEMLSIKPASPVEINLPDPKDETYSRANCLKFSGLTYIQIFTYLVGLYLVNMMKASLRNIPSEVAKQSAPPEIWQLIINAPHKPFRGSLELSRDYAMGAMFECSGEEEEPFRLVGDYKTPSRTIIAIPGWS